MDINQNIKKVLISEEELDKRIKELGRQLSTEYEDKKPIMLCLLKGSISFFSHLCENMNIPLEYEFLRASSYSGTQTTGEVKLTNIPNISIENRHVLIVEDIIDTGITLTAVKKALGEMNPASLKIITMLDKPSRRVIKEMQPEYVGFTIPDEFVVGFGLDYDEEYRNLPYVGVVKEELYQK